MRLTVEAVGDFNGDGNADVLVRSDLAAPAFQKLLYADMHDGVFNTWVEASTGLDEDWQLRATADVHNDGFTDLIVQQQSTGDVVYATQGPSGFASWGTVADNINTDWVVV